MVGFLFLFANKGTREGGPEPLPEDPADTLPLLCLGTSRELLTPGAMGTTCQSPPEGRALHIEWGTFC